MVQCRSVTDPSTQFAVLYAVVLLINSIANEYNVNKIGFQRRRGFEQRYDVAVMTNILFGRVPFVSWSGTLVLGYQ